jgi:hypothetical protein
MEEIVRRILSICVGSLTGVSLPAAEQADARGIDVQAQADVAQD